MELSERIKYIREDLGLTRASFGATLGVSGDVVNNMERGRVDIKDYMLRLICKTHRVNYFWLTEEKGDPYLGPPDILMDDVVEKYSLDDFDRKIVEEYVKLDPDSRSVIKKFIQNVIKEAPDA